MIPREEFMVRMGSRPAFSNWSGALPICNAIKPFEYTIDYGSAAFCLPDRACSAEAAGIAAGAGKTTFLSIIRQDHRYR